jgi:hypothetical protein
MLGSNSNLSTIDRQ